MTTSGRTQATTRPRTVSAAGESAPRSAKPPRNPQGERTRPAAVPSAQPSAVPNVENPDESLRRSFWWWGRAAFALGSVLLAVQLLGVVREIATVFLAILLLATFGAILALLCGPLVALLERRLPRTGSVLFALGIVVACVAGLVALISAPLISEGRALFGDLPRLQRPLDAATAWLADRGLQVGNVDLRAGITHAFGGSGSGLASLLVTAISGTFSVALDIVVVLITAFWLLRDDQALKRSLIANLPAAWRPHAEFVLDAAAVVIGGYVRAQVAMALLVGSLAGFGCLILGVPFPLVVAVATGLFELIPLVGAFVGAAVGALLALTVSPILVAETLALFLVIHIIEGYLIAPRVQARFVRIHPLVAFLALIAGAEAGGFLGAMFAVPVASLAALLLRSVLGDVRASRPELFDAEAVAANAEVAGRRRRLLREYRLFKTSPIRLLRERMSRL